MLSEFEAYKDLDTLPIYNWFQFHKKNEWKYLLKLSDYSQKVSISKEQLKKLSQLYDDLICEFDELDLEVIKEKWRLIILIYDFVGDIIENGNQLKDFKDMDAAIKMLTNLNNIERDDYEWLFKLPIKTQELRRQITDIAKGIVEYNKLKDNQPKAQDLNVKVVKLNSELGIKIDIYKDSVKYFMACQKEYIERINVKNKLVQ